MSLIERVATALYDHCHEAEHGEVYENETEAGREYWNSFASAAIAAMPQLEAMQAALQQIVDDGESINEGNALFMARLFVDMARASLHSQDPSSGS